MWDVVRPGDEEFSEALESAQTIVRQAYDTHRGGRKTRDLAKTENLLASELTKIYASGSLFCLVWAGRRSWSEENPKLTFRVRAVKSLLQENLLESGSTARLNFAFYSAQVIPYEITADKRSHPTHTFP